MAFKNIQKLSPLAPGATIGIVTPGGPSSVDRFELGLKEVHARGFKTVCPLDPTTFYGRYDHGFASGSAQDRLSTFRDLVLDPEVALLLSVRGAYGSMDILPSLDFEIIRKAGKTLVGMSDISALLLPFAACGGIPAVHGPSLASAFADAASDPEAKESVDMLLRLLQDPGFRPEFPLTVLKPGRAGFQNKSQGQIIAANLTMLLCLLGTPWDFDYSDCILVIEEVGESPFRIHRAFTQLRLAGKLDKLSGIVLGRFSRCEAKHGPSVDDVLQLVLRDLLAHTDYPVLQGLPLGHWGKNLPLPLGCRAEIKGEIFRLLESPLRDVAV